MSLLEQGYKIRHETWDDDKYIELNMEIVNQDFEPAPLIIDNPYDFDGWEQYLCDGWYTRNGGDFLKYDDFWHIWDRVRCEWDICEKPKNPWLKKEGRFHPENYCVESQLVDNIPF